MELFLQKKEEEEIISHKFALTTTNCGLQQLLSCTWPRLSQCEQAVKYLKVAVFNLQPLWSWLSTNTKKWKFSSCKYIFPFSFLILSFDLSFRAKVGLSFLMKIGLSFRVKSFPSMWWLVAIHICGGCFCSLSCWGLWWICGFCLQGHCFLLVLKPLLYSDFEEEFIC